jgi:hypothetical protein
MKPSHKMKRMRQFTHALDTVVAGGSTDDLLLDYSKTEHAMASAPDYVVSQQMATIGRNLVGLMHELPPSAHNRKLLLRKCFEGLPVKVTAKLCGVSPSLVSQAQHMQDGDYDEFYSRYVIILINIINARLDT